MEEWCTLDLRVKDGGISAGRRIKTGHLLWHRRKIFRSGEKENEVKKWKHRDPITNNRKTDMIPVYFSKRRRGKHKSTKFKFTWVEWVARPSVRWMTHVESDAPGFAWEAAWPQERKWDLWEWQLTTSRASSHLTAAPPHPPTHARHQPDWWDNSTLLHLMPPLAPCPHPGGAGLAEVSSLHQPGLSSGSTGSLAVSLQRKSEVSQVVAQTRL